MKETYLVHHGVKGQKWGVHKNDTTGQSSKKRKGLAIYRGLSSRANNMIKNTDPIKRMEFNVKLQKRDIDKLNLYNDYNAVAKHTYKDAIHAPKDPLVTRFIGTENYKKILHMNIDSSKKVIDHSSKKINELINKIGEENLITVQSRRSFYGANVAYTWNGSEYRLKNK